jgi:2,5-diketo-D-gluconate reductase B
MMLYKKLYDGNEIPMIGIGTWLQTDKEKCINAIKYSLKIGYRHIDTADIYGNHQYIKEAIEGFDREELFITTKLWKDFLDPKLVESQCDKALMQLGLDYLDLYLIHWPDRQASLDEVYSEMLKLKDKGKVKSVGVSNYTINHLQDLLNQNKKIAVNQIEFHPYLNQDAMLSFCNKHAIAITAYSPLARRKILNDPDIKQIAKKHSKSTAQISLRWLVQKDIIVIPKATSEKNIKENFEIFNFQLDEDDMKKIDQIGKTRPKRIIDPDFSDFEY